MKLTKAERAIYKRLASAAAKARAASLTPERRSEIATIASRAAAKARTEKRLARLAAEGK